RLLAKPLAIGRVGKKQVKGLDGAGVAEPSRVAAENLRAPLQAERLDIVADQATALRGFLHEQAMHGTARDRLYAERAGAGEEVEHARALRQAVIGMGEHIEHRLAGAVRGRPDPAVARCRQGATAELSPDNAHQSAFSRAARAR